MLLWSDLRFPHDVEHLFMCLLVGCPSSLQKCPCRDAEEFGASAFAPTPLGEHQAAPTPWPVKTRTNW